MPIKKFLPYKNLGETLSLELNFGDVKLLKSEATEYLVDEESINSPFAVEVKLSLEKKISVLFPSHEHSKMPFEVVLCLTSVDGSLRNSTPLKHIKGELYSGCVNIDPEIIRDSIKLVAYVIRNSKGSDKQFAHQKGCRLMWSPAIHIRLKENLPRKGGGIKIIWEDFSNPKHNVVPEGFEKALYYLDMDKELPIIYLNKKSSNPLIKLLQEKGSGHQKAYLRDSILKGVFTQVQCHLTLEAMKDLHREAQIRTPVDLDNDISPKWKRVVIRDYAYRIWSEMTPADAEQKITTDIEDDGIYQQVVDRLTMAVQNACGLKEVYEKIAEGAYTND
jgi:hypothetical protein